MNVTQIVNKPVSSNTYVIWNDYNSECIIIDPGSKEPIELCVFIEENKLTPIWIFLTHEHFDHVWGTNILKEKYNVKVACSRKCAEKLSEPQNYFNLLYFNDDSFFSVVDVDLVIDEIEVFSCMNIGIEFVKTPGHSSSSICIYMDGNIFTGDTILNGIKPFIKKRHEGSVEEFRESVKLIYNMYSLETKVYPGHGRPFILGEMKNFYLNY